MNKTAAEVEREVEGSRRELDRTVEALKDKMTPGQLFDEASRAMGGAGQQVLTKFLEQAKENPMPLAVMGLGLAWLMASGNKSAHPTGSQYYPPAGETRSFAPRHDSGGLQEKVGALGEKASGMVDQAKSGLASAASSVSHAGHAAGHGLQGAASHTMHGAESAMHSAEAAVQKARTGVSDMIEREPLLLGALGVVVGIAIGAALPSTDAEDKLVGETRDNLMQKGRELAEEGLDKAAQMVGAAYGAAKEDLVKPPEEGTNPADRAAEVVRDAIQAGRDSTQPH